MKRIIIDVMGSDKGTEELVRGVRLTTEEMDAEYILVGDRTAIEEAAKACELPLDRVEIVHASGVITMEDDPLSVMRTKMDSSMSVGLKLLAEGKGDAFVSAGNTGALFTGANLIVRKIKGARRPALAAMLPMQPPVLLLDSGANVSVTSDYLEQFAVMGSVYMKKMMGVENPRVGLLNNGSEEHKGTEIQIEAYQKLKQNPEVNFVGNVEGNRVMFDTCDVLVTDGFAGNILLKTMEGMGKLMLKTMKKMFFANFKTKLAALMVKSSLKDVKKNFDAGEFGGAPILGIARPVIKGHGSSDAKAFKNAIRQAITYSETDLTGDLTDALSRLSARKKAEKAAAADGQAE
ncbi:MAG: phosphate acyltransferase PlsX [Clostridia bacterium]|nr:phosphate acyltransferase PlsX [Clostridia bacterium]